MTAARRITVPQALLDEAIAQALAESPNECCGLFAGMGDRVTHRLPLVNSRSSSTRFESSAESMFTATREMRRLGIDIVAVYHSHPASPPVPSSTDREWNYSADVANVIISLAANPPAVAVWWLTETDATPADWAAI